MGSQNGGLLLSQDGAFAYTLFSSDVCDVFDLPKSKFVGKFSEVCLYSEKIAFGIHEPSHIPDSKALVKFTLSNMQVNWEIVHDDIMCLRPGTGIRKHKDGIAICYMVDFKTVEVLNNPGNKSYA